MTLNFKRGKARIENSEAVVIIDQPKRGNHKARLILNGGIKCSFTFNLSPELIRERSESELLEALIEAGNDILNS
jgi:hypothetical protein